jgi:hypothetical protein
MTELNSFLIGWLHYYRLAVFRGELIRLDEWIRRRLRSYRLKQGKRGRSISAFLRSMGLPSGSASKLGSSGKGSWRLADTPQLHRAMPIRWFHTPGTCLTCAQT